MTRAPLASLLAEVMAEVSRQEEDNEFLPTWNALDVIAETATDLSYDAESAAPDHVAYRRRGGVKMAVLALRLVRDGCGGANA